MEDMVFGKKRCFFGTFFQDFLAIDCNQRKIV